MGILYFPEAPIKLDFIYFHTGRFVVLFADAEDSVEACNEMFSVALKLPSRDRPRSTQRRITMFRECIAKVRITDEQRAEGISLIDRFAVLADHRQWIVHGCTDESFQTENPIVCYMKRSLGKGNYEFRDYHLADVETHADECLRLCSNLWDWLTEELGFATPDDVNQAARKIGVELA
jgi:hypothetical protein